MRNRANIVLFFLLLVLPLAALTIFEVRYATDRYHSESSIIITEERGTVQSLDLSAIGLPAVSTGKDALVMMNFITSLDMLQYLDSKLQIRAHYSAPNIDWWARLPANASLEDFHTYMQSYLVVTFDQDSQVIHIMVQAFDREYAQSLVNTVLARSQEFVDKLNSRITAEQTQFFEKQLAESEQRVREVKKQLLKFQRENRLLTTEAQATMVNSNIAELDKALIAKQGELATRLKEVNENSPIIQALRNDIGSIKAQLEAERDRLSGGSAAAVSELDAQFREIEFNLDFVSNIYKSNLGQLEQARIDAVRRLKYLIVVTQPSIADQSIFPDRTYIIGTAAILLLMIYFIVSLIVAIIREHS